MKNRLNRNSEGKTLIQRTTTCLKDITILLSVSTQLIVVSSSLAVTLIALLPEPGGVKLPAGCTERTLKVSNLPPTQATDVIFFLDHPKRHGKKINPVSEPKLVKEWWRDFDEVQKCRRREKPIS